jgi:hypothetical protein
VLVVDSWSGVSSGVPRNACRRRAASTARRNCLTHFLVLWSHPRLFLSYSTWRRRCSRQYVCLHPRPPTPSRIPLVANVRPRRVLLHLRDALQLCAHALSTLIRITTLHRHATLLVPARARLSLIAVALFPAMLTVRELSNAKGRPKCAVAKKSKKTSLCRLPTSRPPQRPNTHAYSQCAREEPMSRQPGCALFRPKSETILSLASSSAWLGRL